MVRQTMLRNNITKIVTENIKYAVRVANCAGGSGLELSLSLALLLFCFQLL
jgi:hypothetical protein